MRDAIKRALADPPPRGAVIVVVAGLLVTLAAVLLTQSPGAATNTLPFADRVNLPRSAMVPLGKGGNTQIVSGKLSGTGVDKASSLRLFVIEASLRAHAAKGAKVTASRCELLYPKGVHVAQSEGRRAAYPGPLTGAAGQAIKKAVSVNFLNGGTQAADISLKGDFFTYARGGNPSVDWPSLKVGRQVWSWTYPKPVRTTHVNFAVILLAQGSQTVHVVCTPEAQAATATQRANVGTAIKLH